MFRMESTSSYESVDVEAAFRYAAGYSVDGNLTTTYEKILQESSIDLVTIGGNAAVATEPISSASTTSANTILEKIRGIISGENAVYSRNNPGVPIAYSVFYLKDNSLAKLGYTTEYTANECVTTQKYNTIDIFLDKFNVVKDCDGVGAGDGEFRVDAYVRDINGKNIHHYTKSIDSGEGANSINKTYKITLEKKIGEKFTVAFYCSEYDKNVWGTTIKDSRMNSEYGADTFEFNSSAQWGLAGTGGGSSPIIESISLGSGNCQVRLNYSVTIY